MLGKKRGGQKLMVSTVFRAHFEASLNACQVKMTDYNIEDKATKVLLRWVDAITKLASEILYRAVCFTYKVHGEQDAAGPKDQRRAGGPTRTPFATVSRPLRSAA
jgi:hypothetical protein